MADKIFAGLDASAIETVPKFDPITKVTVTNGENSWSRGDDTGRELRVELPIAKSTNGGTFAQNILAKVSGLRYQPYNANGALIDPAAEIGDGVTIGGVYGGIYEQNSRFDQLHSSDIGAVADEELDNEYPYLSAQERDAIRQKSQTTKNTNKISVVVDDDDEIIGNNVVSSINGAGTTSKIDGENITAKTITSNQIASQTIVAGNMATDSIINRCIASGSIAKSTCNQEVQGILADAVYAAQVFAGQVTANNLWANNVRAKTYFSVGNYSYWHQRVTIDGMSYNLLTGTTD